MLFGNEFDQAKVKTTDAEINLAHAGSGEPLLLLHGYPQTHVMWHKVAPRLTDKFHIICPDLRGYGDSSKPESTADHYTYSKRAMAQDIVEVMDHFGYEKFLAAGHDRGARVLHRLALDYPEKLKKGCMMDIAPTHYMFMTADKHFATGYYHWFFLIQPDGLPEKMIGPDPAYYLKEKIKRWAAPGAEYSEEAVAEYVRCFSDPQAIHASCEDYRAAASIDFEHDEQDRDRKVECPLLILWGGRGFIERTYDVIDVWKEYAEDVQGKPLDCGHFLPEEASEAVIEELRSFF